MTWYAKLARALGWDTTESTTERVTVRRYEVRHASGTEKTYYGHYKTLDDGFIKFYTHTERGLLSDAVVELVGPFNLHEFGLPLIDGHYDPTIIDSVEEVINEEIIGYDTVEVTIDWAEEEVVESDVRYCGAYPERRRP